MDEINKFEVKEHLQPMETCNVPKNSNTMCKEEMAKKLQSLQSSFVS
jgi:hypothetical protein